MQKALVLLLACFMAVACGQLEDAASFKKALEASTGQGHYVAKITTETPGYVVYQNIVTGEYVAYNLSKWDRKNMTTLAQYEAVAVNNVDIVRNLSRRRELVTDSEGTSRWVTFYSGSGFRFENNSAASKDLDTIAALKEEAARAFVASRLTSEYSLSSKRADEIAKLSVRYQRLESVRELTASEKDKFALEALGVSMSQVESALKAKARGNEASYEGLLNTAARVNGTTPEQIGRIFTDMEIGAY